jgi:hypothetical protein
MMASGKRTIRIVDAHCDDGNCFVVRADEEASLGFEKSPANRFAFVRLSNEACEWNKNGKTSHRPMAT